MQRSLSIALLVVFAQAQNSGQGCAVCWDGTLGQLTDDGLCVCPAIEVDPPLIPADPGSGLIFDPDTDSQQLPDAADVD